MPTDSPNAWPYERGRVTCPTFRKGERDGFYQAQLIRELAVRHITGWSGVELEGGPARLCSGPQF